MEEIHNFHVPLPTELYSKLREEAERSKRPATALARQAIEDWLKQGGEMHYMTQLPNMLLSMQELMPI